MTPWPVRTDSDSVICTAEFGLVFRVPLKVTYFMFTVSKLAFIAVLAFTVFHERATEFGFIAVRILCVALVPVTLAESTVTWPVLFTVVEYITEYGIGRHGQAGLLGDTAAQGPHKCDVTMSTLQFLHTHCSIQQIHWSKVAGSWEGLFMHLFGRRRR